MSGSGAWVDQALRLNARYVEEIVIDWGLCPWAAQAWRGGAVIRRVLLEAAPDPAAVLAFIDDLTSVGPSTDPSTGGPPAAIGLAIWPRLALDAAGFGAFAEQVRRADRLRRPANVAAPFLIAAFHPELRDEPPPDPPSLVPFIRRTPDPTLQLVRATLLEDLGRGGRDLSGEIAGANFAKVTQRTAAALDAALRDIRRDRDASYARLPQPNATADR